MRARPQAATDPLRPVPVADPVDARGLVEWNFATRLEHNRAPHTWLATGPLPTAAADALLADLSGVAAAPSGDDFHLLDGDHVALPDIGTRFDPRTLSLIDRQRRAWSLDHLLPEPDRTLLLYAELRSLDDRIMRFDHQTPGLRAWLGGQPIASGDRVHFGAGIYGLLVAIPSPAGERGLTCSPRFYRSDDPAAERRAWQDHAERIRPHLRRAVELAPDSPEGRAAQRFLDQDG